MESADFLTERANALVENAKTRPLTARAALRWIELAERTAALEGADFLAEALSQYSGAVRNLLNDLRKEDHASCQISPR